MSVDAVQNHKITNLVAYLRRQGGQCNAQQPIVPVAGGELLKAADFLDAAIAATTDSDLVEALDMLVAVADTNNPKTAIAITNASIVRRRYV